MLKNHSEKKCGLIGKTLAHSFSPQIHGLLSDYKYSLIELPEDKLGEFIKSDSYHALNVTIPYKRAVIPYLDGISETAQKIGAVNVIKRLPDGRLFGDNTDFYGFIYMIKQAGIEVSGKNALILGTGGTSSTARAALEHMGAKSIRLVSRTGEICYENAHLLCPDTHIIVNTTPVGMYPNNSASPIDISKFPCLEGVADVIFNPQITRLLMDAQARNIPCTNGLSMLVEQARCACEIFTDMTVPVCETEKITGIIKKQVQNIILVGMAGCGKTTVGRLLAERLGRQFIDTDELIVQAAGKSIPDIFRDNGEDTFRALEHTAVEKAGAVCGAVIATGGGVVTREENYAPLHQNGFIVFLTRDTDKLARNGRPLSLSGNLEEMYKKRLPMYLGFCDISVQNTTPTDTVEQIIKEFSEDKK